MKTIYPRISFFPYYPADNLNWFDNDQMQILDKLLVLPSTILTAFINLLTSPLVNEKMDLYVSREHEKAITIVNERKKLYRKKSLPKISSREKNKKISLEKIQIFKERKYVYYGD